MKETKDKWLQLRVSDKTKQKLKEVMHAHKRSNASDAVRYLIAEEHIRIRRRKNYEEIMARNED